MQSFSFEKCFGQFAVYFLKGRLKRDFLGIYLETFFGNRKFKNPSAMSVIFFLKMFKIESKFRKSKKQS